VWHHENVLHRIPEALERFRAFHVFHCPLRAFMLLRFFSNWNGRLVLGIEKPLLDRDHVPAFAQFAVWVAGIQLPVVDSVTHNLLRIHFSACSNRSIFSSETVGSQDNVTVVIGRISFIS